MHKIRDKYLKLRRNKLLAKLKNKMQERHPPKTTTTNGKADDEVLGKDREQNSTTAGWGSIPEQCLMMKPTSVD